MKQYELTVLIHPDLEMNLGPAIDKLTQLVESAGGKIIKEVDEGKKKLAYGIAGQDFAIYRFLELELPPEAPQKIENALGIADEFIRHLLVKKDERKEKAGAKRKNGGEETEGKAEE